MDSQNYVSIKYNAYRLVKEKFDYKKISEQYIEILQTEYDRFLKEIN